MLDAAVKLADEIGVPALSMRKLGQALGVEAMSLYNHVANKDDLLAGITDRVIAEIEPPSLDDPWPDAMRRRAHSARAVLHRHPWATMLIVSQASAGPAMMRYLDATLGCLLEAGFSYRMADHAWNAIDNHIYGFTLQELNFPFEPEEYAEAAAAFLPQIPADRFPYFFALSKEVAGGRYDGLYDFDFGLDLILDGLQQRLERERERP